MAEVNWINGTILPKESGEYYIIAEAKEDLPSGGIRKGDIEIDSDWFDASVGGFYSYDNENPTWKVLSWAKLLKPSIPQDLIGRVKTYFGCEVDGAENG